MAGVGIVWPIVVITGDEMRSSLLIGPNSPSPCNDWSQSEDASVASSSHTNIWWDKPQPTSVVPPQHFVGRVHPLHHCQPIASSRSGNIYYQLKSRLDYIISESTVLIVHMTLCAKLQEG